MSSIFTKIIKGEIPAYKLHEDEFTLSILTLGAIQLGHSIIFPKVEVDHHLDVEDPYYLQVFKNAKPLGKAIMQATGCKRIGGIIQGFEVPHFHYHLVPMWDPSDGSFSKAKERSGEEMEAIAKVIKSKLADQVL